MCNIGNSFDCGGYPSLDRYMESDGCNVNITPNALIIMIRILIFFKTKHNILTKI